MDFSWKPYVPVAKRRERAARLVAKLKLAGESLAPVTAARGSIAKTYWGKAWCQNLERYSDYSSRLPLDAKALAAGKVAGKLAKKPSRKLSGRARPSLGSESTAARKKKKGATARR